MDASLEERQSYSARLMIKHPDRIPVIIENNLKLDNYKYLLPKSLLFSEFLVIIRKKITLNKFEAIYSFVKNENEYILVPMRESIGELYNRYKNLDNFFYIRFGIENTFGWSFAKGSFWLNVK